MSIDQEIISYLCTFGDTKESELIDYCIRTFGQSEENVKKLLDDMDDKYLIKRVVHAKLEPQVVYLQMGSPGKEMLAKGVRDEWEYYKNSPAEQERTKILVEKIRKALLREKSEDAKSFT